MPNRNEFCIIGHLGRDPELRYSKNGNAYTFFSVAVTERFNDKEYTDWVPVTAFGAQAEVTCQYFKKGSAIEVIGKIKNQKNKDGNYETKLFANLICKPLYKSKSQQPAQQAQPVQDNAFSNQAPVDQDLPF